MNRIFGGACRKLGIKRVKYKKREVNFRVKAMGLKGMPVTGVDSKDIQMAVEELVKIWRKENSLSVLLMISAKKGIQIKDNKGNDLFSYRIYNVANCAVHRDNPEIFVFIGKQTDNSTSCHAFYCDDPSQAEEMCSSMANAFHKAFEAWMKHNGTVDPSHGTLSEFEGHGNGSDDVFLSQQNIDSELSRGVERQGHGVNSRSSSILSEGSTFSFGSEADEAFSILLSFPEEEEDS